MELGKLKYVWFRWPALFFLFFVACLGLWMLYIAFLSGDSKFDGLFPLLHVIGFFFSGFGIGLGIEHYLNGITYIQNGKISLNEFDQFVEYNNGLLIVLKNFARLFIDNHKEMLDRGYIKIVNEFDRNKKLKKGTLRID